MRFQTRALKLESTPRPRRAKNSPKGAPSAGSPAAVRHHAVDAKRPSLFAFPHLPDLGTSPKPLTNSLYCLAQDQSVQHAPFRKLFSPAWPSACVLTPFTYQHKTLDVITLFHKPSVPASVRVQTLLKQISAQASETATEDQVGDHSHQDELQRTQFELNVTEEAPTKDQMRTILEYVGGKKASQLVDGARDEADALKKLGEDSNKFKRPVVGDIRPSYIERRD